MGEEAALAHAGGLREPSDGESVDALHRCEPRGGLQDPLPAALAVRTGAAPRLSEPGPSAVSAVVRPLSTGSMLDNLARSVVLFGYE